MTELVRHPLVDEILDANAALARGQERAYEGYRNHAHRVHNFVRAIEPLSAEDEEKVAIAAAFHDLYALEGLDYLEPSIEAAGRFLVQTGRESWDLEVALMIAHHHRVRPYRGEHARLVDAFRRADWNEVSLGRLGGVPREVRRAADAEFPAGAFIQKAIPKLTADWIRHHPLRPAPIFRGSAALKRTGRG